MPQQPSSSLNPERAGGVDDALRHALTVAMPLALRTRQEHDIYRELENKGRLTVYS